MTEGTAKQPLILRPYAGDGRTSVTNRNARYFGAELGERSLIPGHDVQLGKIRWQDGARQPA